MTKTWLGWPAWARVAAGVGVGALIILGGLAVASGGVKAMLVRFHPGYDPPQVEGAPRPTDPDASRPLVAVDLRPVADGLVQPTDIAFVPGLPSVMVVLQKTGAAVWFDLEGGGRGELLTLPVLTASEQGLLGIAFHPHYQENGLFYLNHNVSSGGQDVTRVAAFSVGGGHDPRADQVSPGPTILEVPQPYANHNGGQLAFGPDGMLYVGLGDGGWRGDPASNGQNPSTFLGSMLRLDVDGAEGARAYRVPPDNPFVGREGALPEVWAWGLRNPWRYSFAPDGRLIVADVGQDSFEEISVVGRGDNMGWNLREGRHCYPPDAPCQQGALVDPFYEYGRREGGSITGGYVYTGAAIPALSGQYVFADFTSGRMWAIPLPPPGGERSRLGDDPSPAVSSLGRRSMLVSTFGRDAAGELYVADLQAGVVSQLVPAGAPSP